MTGWGGRGLSWSLHRDCAEELAQVAADRHGVAGLYRAVVPGAAVLAMFGDWREQEVVVNPDFLRRRIELITTVGRSAEAVEQQRRFVAIFGV